MSATMKEQQKTKNKRNKRIIKEKEGKEIKNDIL